LGKNSQGPLLIVNSKFPTIGKVLPKEVIEKHNEKLKTRVDILCTGRILEKSTKEYLK